MDKFAVGTVCYHLATDKKCVVMSLDLEKGLVKVRTKDDEERDYLPHELKTQAEVDAEWSREANQIMHDNKTRDLGGFGL